MGFTPVSVMCKSFDKSILYGYLVYESSQKSFVMNLGIAVGQWTAGQYLKRSVLHLGHGSYQNSSH